MQDDLGYVVRLQREHGGILEAITGYLNALDEASMGTIDEVRKVTGQLAALHSDLSEHIRFEEQEVLIRLASYAGEILRRGIVLEHEEILASISELMEESRDLTDGISDKTALGLFWSRFTEKMQDIRLLVEDHANKQKVILELAWKALDKESEHKRQP